MKRIAPLPPTATQHDGAQHQRHPQRLPGVGAGHRWLVGHLLQRVVQFSSRAAQLERERFGTLLRISADWYWEQDAQFRLTHVEGRADDRLVQEASLHMGKTRWELAAPGMSDAQWEEHRALLERHQEFRDFEFERRDQQGCSYPVHMTGISGPGGPQDTAQTVHSLLLLRIWYFKIHWP